MLEEKNASVRRLLGDFSARPSGVLGHWVEIGGWLVALRRRMEMAGGSGSGRERQGRWILFKLPGSSFQLGDLFLFVCITAELWPHSAILRQEG